MRIDGITCCVGETYVRQLSKSIRLWLDTLDSLTIVTDASTYSSLLALVESEPMRSRAIIRLSYRFHEHGATFNKAAALCEAYATAKPSDWVLHFDSDIIPPEYWRRLTEQRITPGNLYGAFRWEEGSGRRLDEAPLFPYGYFHLWHSLDPNSFAWPIFEYWHPHAGNYDSEFAEQWPSDNRLDLGFGVVHQGEPRQNWMGPSGGDMDHLHAVGLWKLRQLAKQGVGILDPPPPALRLFLGEAEADPVWTREVLRACALGCSFAVTAHRRISTLDKLRGVPRSQFTIVTPRLSLTTVQKLISHAQASQLISR